MKVALCVIGRLENQYAVEFIEWYKNLGFDKILVYDNNHDGEEHFEDVLQPFIDSGFVKIEDCRDKEVYQLKAYNDCYSRYKDDFDWIAFFDFDEFLVLKKKNNIKDFLSEFNDYQCVKINWMTYTDNNLVFYENKPCNERFTTPMEYDKKVQYDFPENNHVKSILRCNIDNFVWKGDPHIPTIITNACDAQGEKSSSTAFQPYCFDNAYLKHFVTKTIQEWIQNKFKRGTPDVEYEEFIRRYKDRFFKYNEKMDKKELYLKSIESVDIFIGTQKTFKPAVTNNVYKIAVGNHEIENESNLELIQCKHNALMDDRFYSEIYMLSHVAKGYPLKKYVGFCHNRRYFNFLDDIPDLDELFETYDAVVSKPLMCKPTVKDQYASTHNIEDLYIIGGILADKFPGYCNSWHNFINGKILIPYNMFIMKKDDFIKYINFINIVLNDYIVMVGGDIKGRIEHNKDKYLKNFYPNNDPQYQYRMGGYLAERLTNVFAMTHFKKMKTYPVIVTEEKYKQNKKDNP